MSNAVEVKNLTYKFSNCPQNSLSDIDLVVPWNTRVILCGSNGAGKSTLLKVLSGKHLCLDGNVLVDGRDPFAPTDSSNTSDVMTTTYLGTEWCHMSFIHRDIQVIELLRSIGFERYSERGNMLVTMLDVDVSWRMHQLSDGQKRRVQLCMGLLKPFKVLFLDEVTVDLDVVARASLLSFLENETNTRQCSIIYATHIFDGLSNWPHYLIHLHHGRILQNIDCSLGLKFSDKIVEDQRGRINSKYDVESGEVTIAPVKSLYPLALAWLSKDEGKRRLVGNQ